LKGVILVNFNVSDLKMKKIYFVIFVFVLFLLAGCGETVNIEFVTNGGSPVEAITSKDDFDQNNLPSPTNEGYVFGGWFLDEDCTISLEDNIPEKLEFKLYAKWIANTYDYKVEYYKEKLDGSYELVETLNLKGVKEAVVNAEEKTYLGFSFNTTKSKKSTTIKTNDNEVLKMYYDRNSYTITFDTDGGSTITEVSFKFQETVTLSSEPVRVGYEFAGWDNLPTTMPANDLTLKANWTPLEVTYKEEIYQENPDDDGFTLVSEETKSALSGSTVEMEDIHSIPQPFIIFLEHEETNQEDTVNGDGSTVLKLFYKRRLINVVFNFYEGKDSVVKQYKYGASDYLISGGERPGFEFMYWREFSSSTAPETVPFLGLEDFNLYGEWKRLSFKISFETDADIAVTSLVALYETPINEPVTPVRQGYIFKGWYTDRTFTTKYEFTTMEARDITLYALWEGLPYTMQFETNGGSIVEDITEAIDTPITKPIPERLGYKFINWYTDEACTKLFNNWVMPYNGIKLYAKWEEETYIISFETNGGSLIPDIVGKLYEQINKPTNNPTREGYIFDGYYSDPELTEEFIFDYIKVGGATVYVKWVDASLATSIAVVLKQDIGSSVEVKGYVYAVLDNAYYGYYLYDDTGYIYIHADNTNINIGDEVSVKGSLVVNTTITNVIDVNKLSEDIDIKDPEFAELEDLYNLGNKHENYYRYFTSIGVLRKVELNYCLFDYINLYEILIDHRSSIFNNLGEFTDSLIKLDYAYDYKAHKLTVVNVEEITDEAEILEYLKQVIVSNYNLSIFEDESDFGFPSIDDFGFGVTINYSAIGENADVYDFENQKFNNVLENTQVKFEIELTLNEASLEFEIEVIVTNKELITISELFSSAEDEYYYLDVIVILIMNDYDSYILKDDTGYLYADYIYNSEELNIGDNILINVYKSNWGYDIELDEIIAREVDLGLDPTKLAESEFSSAIENDELDIGEYVELTGYITFDNDRPLFVCDEKVYFINLENYENLRKLEKFIYYTVYFRTYVFNFDGDIFLYYSGVREDVRFVEYDDAEAVNAIQETFRRIYGGVNFSPFEEFNIPTRDLVYGIEIEYVFSEESLPYYVDGKFINVDESTPISINFTLRKNEVTLNFTYNTNLVPFTVTPINELLVDGYDSIQYIKGLVVYRNQQYIVIQDDTGCIRYNSYNLPIYVGDYVLVAGFADVYNNEIEFNDYDEHGVIEIYSRGNDVSIAANLYSIQEIYDLEIKDRTCEFIQVSGYLFKEEGNGWYYLTDGINKIRLYEVDDYTYYSFERNVNHYITIRSILGYQFDDIWYVYYQGGIIDKRELTEQERLDLIKNYILLHYDGLEVEEDSYVSIKDEFYEYGGTIEYSFTSEYLTDYYGNIYTEYIDEVTTVTITATITVGSLTESVDFDITIYPEGNTSTLPILTISEAYAASSDEEVRIVGTIVTVTYVNYQYQILIEDETGVMFVRFANYQYYYSNPATTIIDLTGYVYEEMGIKYFYATKFSYAGYKTISVDFQEYTIPELLNLNYLDQANQGKPIQISGTIEGRYITDGYNKIGILCPYFDESSLNKYNGYRVTLKGFYYGFSGDIRILYSNSYYYGTVIIEDEYSDEEKVARAKKDLQDSYYYYDSYEFYANSFVYLEPNFSHFPSCTYTYSIIGESIAYIDTSYLYFVESDFDYIVSLRIDINCGEYSDYVVVNFKVLGKIEIHTLDELFLDEPGTKEIHLIGEALLVTYDFIYFLVGGEVYKLNEPGFSNWVDEGEFYYIFGQKSIIDGKVNYSYNIYLDYYYDDEYPYSELEIVDIDIATLYNQYNIGTDLRKDIYELQGILNYDPNSDFYYFEKDEQIIYIRDNSVKYIPTIMRDIMPMNGYDLGNDIYINENVNVLLLFADELIYGEYLVLDLLAIKLVEMTSEEHLDHAILDIKDHISNMVFYPGDYFVYDFDPKYIHNYDYNLEYDIAVKNPEDEKYFFDNYYYIGIVEEEMYVTFEVTLSDGTYTKTFEQDIHIMPISKSTVEDVLYGIDGELYLIEGIVQTYSYDEFIVLKDETGTIVIAARWYEEDVEFEIGDKLKILGYRDYYDWGNATPILETFGFIINTGEKVEINNDATLYDITHILKIEYTNPGVYTMYVVFTGVVRFTGNYYYPCYGLVEAEYGNDYTLELVGPTYDEFNEMMQPLVGETINVKGWLVFKSTYSRFLWDLIYDSHVVIE